MTYASRRGVRLAREEVDIDGFLVVVHAPSLLVYLADRHPELEPSRALDARMAWADDNVDEPEAQALVAQQVILRQRLRQELMTRSMETDEEVSSAFAPRPHPDESPSGVFPEGPHGITMLEDLTAPPQSAEVISAILEEAITARREAEAPKVAPPEPAPGFAGALLAVGTAVLVVLLEAVGAGVAG